MGHLLQRPWYNPQILNQAQHWTDTSDTPDLLVVPLLMPWRVCYYLVVPLQLPALALLQDLIFPSYALRNLRF
jgi:hypothetical protein